MSLKRFIARKQTSIGEDDASSTRSSDQDSLHPSSERVASCIVGKRAAKHDELGPAAREAAIHRLLSQPVAADPIEFVTQAFEPLFTWNPKHDPLTLQDLREHHIPRYFDVHYKHRHNTQIYQNVDDWFARIQAARQELVVKKSRMRIISTRQDRLIKQSMQQACIGVTAEYIVDTPHQEETVRVPLMGIYMIEGGKLKEGTNVMDVSVFRNEGPEVSCVIM